MSRAKDGTVRGRPQPKRAAASRQSGVPNEEEKRRREAQSRRDKMAHRAATQMLAARPGPNASGPRAGIGKPRACSLHEYQWGLQHPIKNRVDLMNSRMSLTLVENTSGTSALVLPAGGAASTATPDKSPGDGKISAQHFLLFWNPGYREAVLAALSDLVPDPIGTIVVSSGTGPTLGGTSTVIDFAADRSAVPLADPPLGSLNAASSETGAKRARVCDGHLNIRVFTGASTYGTLVISRYHPSLLTQTIGVARNAMINDFHTVKRFSFSGAGHHEFNLSAGLMNPNEYGTMHDYGPGRLGVPTEEPLSGYIIGFQQLQKGPFDPDPTLWVESSCLVQTELGLDDNHLQTTHKELGITATRTRLQTSRADAVSMSASARPNLTQTERVYYAHAAFLRGSNKGGK